MGKYLVKAHIKQAQGKRNKLGKNKVNSNKSPSAQDAFAFKIRK
jgi:hypothetical protein